MSVRIAGYACRLPGARSVEEFWNILDSRRCVVSYVPEDRFETARYWHPNREVRGKSVTFAAGVIDGAFDFDATFFGVSPREALQMDPQQRLLLHVVWEALESAGLPPSSLAGQNVGVYVGASSFDYLYRFILDPDICDTQMMTGNTLSIIANRISYQFDLRGPSFVVDTACSSSLVALAQACQAISEGRVETAIVAGVNLVMAPYPFVGFSTAHMLSPSGRCRAFDADGDGYVRSEGAVALVIQAASAAQGAGFGDIVGWGANADGRTNGLSLPSSASQADLLRHVYGTFAIDPDALAFIEAHGTGTRVGDPAEAFAIGEAVARRRKRRLPIGSAKTNVGHLEPVSGLVGVLKSSLALREGMLPASLHFETPNPDIPFEDLNLEVAASPVAFDPTETPLAGVSSFGFGGANAHVVLRAPESKAVEPPVAARRAPLVVSAQTEGALRGLASAYRTLLSDDAADGAAIANAAAYRRDMLDRRAIVDASSDVELREALDAVAEGRDHRKVVYGRALSRTGRTLFAFSGNGSQWAGMARVALSTDATFARALEEVDAELEPLVGWSAQREILADDLEEKLKAAHFAQPLLFAIQVSVVKTLAARGLRPDAVFGHSVGEVAAAWASGALSLKDAARVIDARSRSQEFARGAGAMAAVNAPTDDIAAAMSSGEFPGLEIAAFNTPGSVTVSGPHGALDAFLKLARERRWPFRRLAIEYPYHTALLEPSRDGLLADLGDLHARDGDVAFFSSVDGAEARGATLDADYWWRNVRQPVHFAQAVQAALSISPAVVVEIGPAPVLGGYMSAIARDAGRPLTVLASLQRDDREEEGSPLAAAANRALASGANVDKARFFGDRANDNVSLPHYAWDNVRFKPSPGAEAYGDFVPRPHVLLGAAARGGDTTYFNHIDTSVFPWIADHKAGGAVVVPAAAIIEIALAAARESLGDAHIELRDCAIYRPLYLEPGALQETKTCVSAQERLIDLFSRRRGTQGDWTLHARAAFAALPPARVETRDGTVAPTSRMGKDEVYALAREKLLDYGPSFQVVESIDSLGDRASRVRFAPSLIDPTGLLADPTLIDGGLQAVLCLPALRGDAEKTYLPTRFDSFRLRQPGRAIAGCDVSLVRSNSETCVANVVYRAEDGSVVAEIVGGRSTAIRLKSAERAVQTYAFVPVLVDGLAAASAAKAARFAPVLSAKPAPELEAAAVAALHVGLSAVFGQRTFDPYLPQPGGAADKIDPARLEPLLAHLASAKLATRDKRGWSLAPVADRAGALGAMLASTPERAVEATFLAAFEGMCADMLSASPARAFPVQTLDALLTRSLAARELAKELTRCAADVVASTSVAPLRVLALGADNSAFVRALLGVVEPLRGSVCVVDADAGRLDALNDAFAAAPAFSVCGPDEAPARSFDLVLGANVRFGRSTIGLDWLRERLADGGRLAIVEWAGGVFADLVQLATDSAGRKSLDEPLTEARLTEAGFEDVAATANGAAAMVVAHRPPRSPAEDAPAIERTAARMWPGGDALAQVIERLEAEILRAAPAPAGEGALETVVHVGCCDPNVANPVDWIAERSLEIRQAILSLEGRPGRVVVVTPGALRGLVGREGGRPESHAVLGFARVCANEYPDCDMRVVDPMRDVRDEATLRALAREVVAPGRERELLLDADARYGARLIATPVGGLSGLDESGETTPRLEAPAQGSIERVVWTRAERRAPGPREIEIEVKATGLNFRDVMWSLGALPPEALEDGFAGPTLGLECAGTVARVGADVAGFAPGQPCLAFAPHAFSGHVTIPASAAAPAPDDLPFEAAATIPVSFVTVYYSLVHLARLEAGETVLVHGGAGGVGLAALQIARLRGARVIATAGQPEKRDLLRDLGVDFVFDSRGQSFADEVMAATGGRGVDVVLNSLAGEAMERSLRCLKPFGRFVELGKVDFFTDTRLGLRPFSRNLSYFGVDADQLLTGRPELASALFVEISALLKDGRLKPLPYGVFDGEDIADALRLMQRSQHVGKIVVRPPARPQSERRDGLLRLRGDGSYVVIGGLGGFGLALARRLAARGAGRIVLIGRRAPSAEASAVIETLRSSGVDIVIRQLDATDERGLAALLNELDADNRPARGLFHCAMSLDDRLVANLDHESFASVLRAKIDIADNLDRLSRGRAIDLFVLFSSATTMVGNPGQANYVAANAYLEELARQRRRAGAPAIAIAWGPISDVGYLTGDDQMAKIAARKLGRHALSVSAALDSLERIVATDDGSVDSSVVGVGRFDFGALRRELALLNSPSFARIAASSGGETVDLGEGGGLARALASLPTDEARSRIVAMLVGEIARIMRAAPDQVDPLRPLAELGVDSLMGVELRLAAEEKLGVDIPLLAIGGAGSITDLAERCLKQIRTLEQRPSAEARADADVDV